jgi:hypothetical protein
MLKVHALVIAVLALLGFAADAWGITATAVDIAPTANCTSSAALNLAWQDAGVHTEFGRVTDAIGTTIGGFGPDPGNGNDNFSGTYGNNITTAQPDGALIGSYAWVGGNPPTEAASVEYFVLYNCSTRTVLYRCLGPYGRCPQTAPQALGLLTPVRRIPASSMPVLTAMMLLLGALGAARLRPRARA